jgi:hypothetical protein
METARIEIIRHLDDETGEPLVTVNAHDPGGDGLPLIESLGMLEMAKMILIEDTGTDI